MVADEANRRESPVTAEDQMIHQTKGPQSDLDVYDDIKIKMLLLLLAFYTLKARGRPHSCFQ